MKVKLLRSLAIPAALVGLLAVGCGEGGKEASDSLDTTPAQSFGADDNGVERVGANVCIGCHEDFSWSEEVVSEYLESKHVIHSTHVAAGEEDCIGCHDPIGDGTTLEDYLSPDLIPDDGLAAVTCEACHGAGGQHFGAGPIPNPKPGPEACGQCHNDALPPPHPQYHPQGMNIAADYEGSRHAATAEEPRNEARCTKCHNDEGARQYKDADTVEQLYGMVVPVEGDVSPIQCRTCHDPHSGELLEEGSSSASAQYATCTNCHQAHDDSVETDPAVLAADMATNTKDSGGKWKGAADGPNDGLIYHGKRWDRVITTTHSDDPTTTAVDATRTVGKIEGYNMDRKNEDACRDCHNVHSADLTINNQWASSAHGGEILEVKESAAASKSDPDPVYRTLQDVANVKAAGVDGAESSWAHYAWQTDGRASCQRCHTASGVKAFLADPADYNGKMAAYVADVADGGDMTHANPADFSYLKTGQQELLYCWGCHVNSSGVLRNPGAVSLSFGESGFAVDGGTTVTLPDSAASNVCVGCHGGRGNGDSMRNEARSSRGKVHYLAASGTLFSEDTHTGYEYEGQDYSNVAYFEHDQIGLDGVDANGKQTGKGPCASCHMGEEGHTFQVLGEDDQGQPVITTQEVCNTCHGAPYTVDAAKLEEESAGYQDALAYLDSVTAYSADAPEEEYGAYCNWYYLNHEPGAYAHNRYYAKRLIFDSLDWMDNSALDGTITIPAAHAAARAWLGADETGVASRP